MQRDGCVRWRAGPSPSRPLLAEDEAGVAWRAWTGVCHPLLPPVSCCVIHANQRPGSTEISFGRACMHMRIVRSDRWASHRQASRLGLSFLKSATASGS